MKEYKLVIKMKGEGGFSTISTKLKKREDFLNKYALEGWKLVGVDQNFFYLERDIE